jgi:hypothetical protein
MIRSTSHALLALVSVLAIPAAAQTCSPPPGSVGLGNFCAEALRHEQKVAMSTQASSAPTSVRAKETAVSSNQPAMPVQTQRWLILPTDGKLAVTFERWATAAGMKLIWDAQQHVMHSSADSFEGTLDQALARVLLSPAIRKSAYPLEACVYPNNPPVLRITRHGDQKECQQ